MDFTGERLVPGKVDVELETEHINRYIFANTVVKDKKVLDAACGTGYGSALMAKTAASVFGVDISDEAISYAKNNYNAPNISFSVADIASLPFEDNFFDVVISFETIEHVDTQKQEKFLSEVKRTLKNDGIFIVSTPNRDVYKNRGENHFHVAELSFAEFKSFLDGKFQNVKIFSQKFEVSNAIIADGITKSASVSNVTLENSDYLVAVASDEKLPEDIGCIVNFYSENKYAQVTELGNRKS